MKINLEALKKEYINGSECFRAFFPFIREDLRLEARLYVQGAIQSLVIQQFNPKNGVVLRENAIRCIQVALTHIEPEVYEEIFSESDGLGEYTKRTLNVIPEENIDKKIPINLTIEERFLAFFSWVAGISEAGYEAIKIQREIEQYSRLIHPISQFFIKFLIEIDNNFIFDYLLNIEKDCTFDGRQHIPSFIANLIPIMNIICDRISYPRGNKEFFEKTKKLYDAVKSIDPPIELFLHDKRFMSTSVFFEDLDIIKSIFNKLQNLKEKNIDRWFGELYNFLLLHNPKSKYRAFPSSKDNSYYYKFNIPWKRDDFEYKVMEFIFRINPPLKSFGLCFEYKQILRTNIGLEYLGKNLIQYPDFVDLNPEEGRAMQYIKNRTNQVFLINCMKTNENFIYPKDQGYACYEAQRYDDGHVYSIIIENYQLDEILEEFLMFPKIKKIILFSKKEIPIPNSFKMKFKIEIQKNFPGFRIILFKKND